MIVTTKTGKLEGTKSQGIFQFLGIPYAEPPVGNLRFRPTVPKKPWMGVRDAQHLGHAAPQLYVPGLTALLPEETLSEDCLYLNITTPSIRGNAPVLFWIHGGAFQKGSGTLGIDPSAFAREGICVVSLNYRLGALGFIDVSRWLGEDYTESGNNGLLDIITALSWVKENIASFGGNPDNISIMGQSAGSKIAATLSIMEKARGLFQKCIMCSGAVQCIRDKNTAYEIADQFLAEAGLTPDTAGNLLTMPWEKILKAQTNLFAGLNLHTVGPVFDSINLKGTDPLALITEDNPPISFLMGTNRDEMNLYWDVYKVHDLDEKLAEKLFGNRAPIVLREYKKIPHDADFHQNFVHFMTEWIYRSGTLKMAEKESSVKNKVYLYRLDWDRQRLKACHASETQFIMKKGSVIKDVDHSPEHEELVREMHNAFLSFIREGIPSAENLPSWPLFEGTHKQMMVFDSPCHVERAPESTVSPDMPYKVFELNRR